MSSSPTEPTSTTASSTSSRSRADGGRSGRPGRLRALAQPAASVVARHDWPVDIHPLPPLLHNRPHLIADEVAGSPSSCAATYDARRGRLRRLRHLRRPRRGLRGARAAPAAGPALLRPVRRRGRAGGGSTPSPAPTCSPTSWSAPSSAPSCASSAWTAGPSSATTTSGTTRGSSGWRRSRTPSCARSPSRPPTGSACR